MTAITKTTLLAITTSILLLTSCSQQMYQVLETTSTNTKIENNKFFYENAEIKINYMLWEEDGRLAFNIYNKTAEPIYIDWNKSHFIIDGISQEYWYDAEDITSFYSTSSNTIFETTMSSLLNKPIIEAKSRRNTTGFVNKTKPKKIIQIPPMSSIIVSKFSLIKTPFFSCEFPIKTTFSKDVIKKSFSKEETPLKFRNYLTYSVQESFEQVKIIDNDFYVSTVSNMNRKVFLGKSSNIEYCNPAGYKLKKRVFAYPYKQANAFYIKRK